MAEAAKGRDELPAASSPGSETDGTARRRLWLGVVTALGLIVPLVGIGGPDPWADEAATMIAVRRGWADLVPLAGGPETPLLPYYVVVKAFVAALPFLPPLVAARTLSAVAGAVAVAALYSLVVRRAGVIPGVVAAVLLVGLPGFSRYAQEARPYALALALTALSWLAWDTWRRPQDFRTPGRWARTTRDAAGYVFALAGTALAHLFGLLHWPAQLVAELTTPTLDRRARLRRTVSSAGAMLAAAVLVCVPVVAAVRFGTGPSDDSRRAVTAFAGSTLRLLTGEAEPWPAVPIVLLAGTALVVFALRARAGRRYRDLTRVLALWLIVPMGLSWVVTVWEPQLLRPRYWAPALAPFAGLAAVGALVLADAASGLLVALRRGRPAAPRAARALVLAGLVLAPIVVLLPQQAAVRAADGHGIRLEPVLARVDEMLAADPGLVLGITPPGQAAALLEVRPEWRSREVLTRVRPAGRTIWPVRRPAEQLNDRLAGVTTVIWLERDNAGREAPTTPPDALADAGFAVVSVERVGDWWLATLRG